MRTQARRPEVAAGSIATRMSPSERRARDGGEGGFTPVGQRERELNLRSSGRTKRMLQLPRATRCRHPDIVTQALTLTIAGYILHGWGGRGRERHGEWKRAV